MVKYQPPDIALGHLQWPLSDHIGILVTVTLWGIITGCMVKLDGKVWDDRMIIITIMISELKIFNI